MTMKANFDDARHRPSWSSACSAIDPGTPPAPNRRAPTTTRSKVGHYTAARPADRPPTAEKVTTRRPLERRRRPELLRLFETEMYGKVPTPPRPIRPVVLASAPRTGRPWAARPSAARSTILFSRQARRPADGPPDLSAEGRAAGRGGCRHSSGLNFERQPRRPASDPGIALSTRVDPRRPRRRAS